MDRPLTPEILDKLERLYDRIDGTEDDSDDKAFFFAILPWVPALIAAARAASSVERDDG